MRLICMSRRVLRFSHSVQKGDHSVRMLTSDTNRFQSKASHASSGIERLIWPQQAFRIKAQPISYNIWDIIK